MTMSLTVYAVVALVILVASGSFVVGVIGLGRGLPSLGVTSRREAATLILLSVIAILGIGLMAAHFDLGQTVTGTVTLDR